jgi:hypothetical protein
MGLRARAGILPVSQLNRGSKGSYGWDGRDQPASDVLRRLRSEKSSKCFAATYRKLASDIEAVIATNAILDEERDKRLVGLLGKDDNHADSIAEIAKLLGQTPEEPKSPEK